jgi:hypothetical protein
MPAAVPPLPPPEPNVYEDLFPIGSVPVETCWMHGAHGSAGGTTTTQTPLVDAALRSQDPQPRISIQRVVGSDGITRTVIRQVRQP